MSDLIERQATIDAVKWGASVRSIRDEIAGLPSAWKSANVKPERDGEYLAVCGKGWRWWWYALLYYGEYEDWETQKTKRGWYSVNDDCDYIEYDDDIWCWMELPDVPEVEE